ncbi:ribosomal protection-like ABC-F family protein [Paenibacillus caui]|uniref:ribosomal protection-like ABC-F family protein n=1 Tax=Paenibacillus caui TaxID=2873927 RepID=UPI001CA990E8|nr:ABC-F family ATP-binding cassette domain-containing protein [Paenibacillus caui]
MTVLKVMNLRKEWNGSNLFSHITFEVAKGERLALFGRNGIGKTTLLRCIKGATNWEEGDIWRFAPASDWGWLDQNVEAGENLSLLEFARSGSTELSELKRKLDLIQQQWSIHPSPDSLLEEYGELYERYVQLDGYGWEQRVEQCLERLKLDPSIWDVPFVRLSGGQKTKVQLASLMVRMPEMIVLDEPTNHLDEETLLWLEKWISDYPGTVLYVSHDRAFIDRTATGLLALDKNGCRKFTGGYTEYRRQKKIELQTLETAYKKQEQERTKLIEAIRRYAQWFDQAHRAAGQNDFLRSKSKKNVSRLHAKEAELQRLEDNLVQRPKETVKLNMQLEAEKFRASTLVRLSDVSFAYNDRPALFKHLNLSVHNGDRFAVLGKNGSGKSTLLKLVTGDLQPQEGLVELHPQARIGYFAQELEQLDLEETLLDSLLPLPDMTESRARTLLGCFLFRRDDVFKKIGELSLGERCRAAFLRLLFRRNNLLILDEPTNYLDIDTREVVEDALLSFPGAVLLVSHDRYLVQKAASRLFILGESETPIDYPGTYEDYYRADRSRLYLPEEQARQNEQERLKLKLARLMSEEEPEDPEAGATLLAEIGKLRRQIDEMDR